MHCVCVRQKNRSFTGRDWALEAKDAHAGEVEIFEDPSAKGGAFANMYEGTDTSYGKITNGKLHAVIDSGSVITFYHEDGRVLLKEHFRRLRDEESMPLNIMGREYSNGVGDNFRIVARFVARKGEKIFGMGQYQQHELDLKGCMLELAQRNSQVSVPFYLSSIGYGFLWNNPGVGQVMFANNGTEWVTESGKEIDYLVIAGDTPAEIEENYMTLTGKPPMMPEYGMGFWQCKLRYWNQEQLAEQKAELEYTQEQIKPHFFLNCLSLIHGIADKNNEGEIVEITTVLSDYMRYIFQDSKKQRDVEEELEHIEAYIRIQKLRYGEEAFSFEATTDGDIGEWKVPSLLLQTLVENSVVHGVSLDRKSEISLYLTNETYEDGEYLYICISDTGNGFSKEALDAIENDTPIIYHGRHHVGISNIKRRLALMYGERASITCSNMDENYGAVVEVRLPKTE